MIAAIGSALVIIVIALIGMKKAEKKGAAEQGLRAAEKAIEQENKAKQAKINADKRVPRTLSEFNERLRSVRKK